MKVFILLLSIVAATTLTSCHKNGCNEFPACVQVKIDQLKKSSRTTTGASVKEYLYEGKTVYLVVHDGYDAIHEVYDGQCNYLGAPSGGLTGKGDGKLPGFYEAATEVRVIWKE